MGAARWLAVVVAGLVPASVAACASIESALAPPNMAKLAPESMTPLTLPRQTMRGGKGDADAPYPADFAVTLKSDGTIAFPQHTPGKLQGPSLIVGGEAVLTVSEDGTVKGPGLKHGYKFADDGALLDAEGHGVRIAPDGAVRAIGGAWRFPAVFRWTPDGGGDWDKTAWRALELVALVMIETCFRRP